MARTIFLGPPWAPRHRNLQGANQTSEWARAFLPSPFCWYSFKMDYFHMVQNAKGPTVYMWKDPLCQQPSTRPLAQPVSSDLRHLQRHFMPLQANTPSLPPLHRCQACLTQLCTLNFLHLIYFGDYSISVFFLWRQCSILINSFASPAHFSLSTL